MDLDENNTCLYEEHAFHTFIVYGTHSTEILQWSDISYHDIINTNKKNYMKDDYNTIMPFNVKVM